MTSQIEGAIACLIKKQARKKGKKGKKPDDDTAEEEGRDDRPEGGHNRLHPCSTCQSPERPIIVSTESKEAYTSVKEAMLVSEESKEACSRPPILSPAPMLHISEASCLGPDISIGLF